MWMQSLPRVLEGSTPSGLEGSVLAAHGIEMTTEWGRLQRLGPVLRMSETPPRWALPPAPLGRHPPRWS